MQQSLSLKRGIRKGMGNVNRKFIGSKLFEEILNLFFKSNIWVLVSRMFEVWLQKGKDEMCRK